MSGAQGGVERAALRAAYLREFVESWRPLLAATIGMALGMSLNHYTLSLFSVELIEAFGWSRARFALIGSVPFVTMAFIPLAGRFADRVGTRTAAIVGFVALPITYFAFSLMTGAFLMFYAIMIVQVIFGVLTTTMVFARVVVDRFDRARGLALSIIVTGAPLAGAIAVPIVGATIDADGWRAGYRLLAGIAIVGGLLAVLMIGRDRIRPEPQLSQAPRFGRAEWKRLARSPVLLLSLGGMLLVNVPQVLAGSQLKLMLQDNGVTGGSATWLVSLYAGGVAVGRIACGLALDRMALARVALVSLGLPAIGLAALAAPLDSLWLLTGAILILGLAQGAEGDIGAFLASRKFELRNYSLILALLTTALTLGAASGSLVLSVTLRRTDSFDAFLIVGAVATLAGALLFFLAGRYPDRPRADPPA